MSHAGGEPITMNQLRELNDPERLTKTHYPIRHDLFVDMTKRYGVPSGYLIRREEYVLQKGGDNLFGVLEIANGSNHDDFTSCIGLRNSGSMKFKAQLGIGGRVLVCDNMCFSASVVVGRKHTRHAQRDLPRLMGKAMATVAKEIKRDQRRVDIYKDTELSRVDVHDIMMQSLRMGAIPSSQIKPWIEVYENPPHECFRTQDCWALQNAFTEVAKRWSFPMMQDRTQRLVGIIDKEIDIASKIDA